MILAGGRARRLGGVDKTLLTVGGRTILARVIAALGLKTLAISANGDPARFAAYGLPVLPDEPEFLGQGPLAGLLAGLDWAASMGAAALLSVPGDIPFPPRDLAARLAPPPACAASLGRLHKLVALWPVEARLALRAHLSRPGPRDVGGFADTTGMRVIDFPTHAWDPFHNVNTMADLEAARCLATNSLANTIEGRNA